MYLCACFVYSVFLLLFTLYLVQRLGYCRAVITDRLGIAQHVERHLIGAAQIPDGVGILVDLLHQG